MNNKIFALILIGFLGLSLTPTLSANPPEDHRTNLESKPSPATDVEIVKKASLPGKGKLAITGKPPKTSEGAAAGIVGSSVSGSGIRYAIIVGIANYPGTGNDLRYSDNDAYAMKDVLVNGYNFDASNIRLLIDEGNGPTTTQPTNATVQEIYNAVSDIKSKATKDDEVVFFFSGHGGKGIANDGDSEKQDESIISHDGVNLIHIWDGDLKNLFSDFQTSRIVFIFDSCVSGGMTDLSVSGRVINMATEEKGLNTAVELDSLGYGEFTYYFAIKGLGQKLADTNLADGTVTIEEAFDYSKKNVDYDHPTINDKFENDLPL